MPRWIEVAVTEDIIRRAEPVDCYHCAVSLALREATGFEWHSTQDSARIEVLIVPRKSMRRTWRFPDKIKRFIRAFDRGEHVEATTFRLPARFADKKWLDYGAAAR
jgi:hypothetical protein